MNKLNDGSISKTPNTIIEGIRKEITSNCEEIIEVGARIRPLLVDKKQIGWIRGVHFSERKIFKRWIYDENEYIFTLLSTVTTLTSDYLETLSAAEINRLSRVVYKMSEYDMSLYPYISAFVTTGVSENLWFGKGIKLSSYEEKIIHLPNNQDMKILAPPDHANLWATLCSYREESKRRLDSNWNALMIVQPWVGKGASSIRNDLKAAQRKMIVDSLEPWENSVKLEEIKTNLDDGWGHTIEDSSVEGLQREIRGMLNNDKHERFMKKFYDQQKQQADDEKKRIQEISKQRGGPGIRFKEVTVSTDKEVRQREKELKQGKKVPTQADRNREEIVDPKKKFLKYM